MKRKTEAILFVVTAMVACVYLQTPAQLPAAQLPPAVEAALEAMKHDVQAMSKTDTWDANKVGAYLTAVGAALQPSMSVAPQAVQDQFNAVQAKVQALSTGNPDKKTVKETLLSAMRFWQSLFPTAKALLHPEQGPKKFV